MLREIVADGGRCVTDKMANEMEGQIRATLEPTNRQKSNRGG